VHLAKKPEGKNLLYKSPNKRKKNKGRLVRVMVRGGQRSGVRGGIKSNEMKSA
jgi:hypothetical protein